MPDNNVSNYTEQGGARTVIRGSLDVASGAEIDVESGGALKIAGTAVTASAAQLNRGAVTTAGVVEANKVIVAGASKDVDTLDVTATFKLAGTQVTATAAQLNRTAVTTAGVVEASKVVVVGASQDVDQLDVTGTFKLAGTKVVVGASAINNLVQGAAANKAITGGEVAFTATTAFDTGLSTLDVVVVSQVSQPSVTNGFWATAAKGTTVGWVDLYSWKPTAANDVEPAAGSASVTVGWIAVGEAS